MPDREKVITTMREQIIKGIEVCYTVGHNCNECPYYNQHDCNDWLMRDALDLLREQESAKPKKARWIRPTYQDCHCSICERQPEREQGEAVPLYPYCPYCGAEMEVQDAD